ncbi:MAG: hypothetical protein KGL35_17235 [Bradyrhizobium sp.]|nr:hypothetical protein [Bradyrhizobium sp.]
MTTRVTLGDLTFSYLEVPETIPFGGEQRLTVHELVGGVRVVDAMGRSDMPLEWSGVFLGETALSRARYLDTLRVSGQALLLTWSEMRYRVVVQRFEASFNKPYEIPYRITCAVVEDQTGPVATVAQASIDDLMSGDMAQANWFGSLIGDGPLSGLLGTLGAAIRGVSSFANAAQSTINAVVAPIQAVQARVGILIASTSNTISNVGTLGGLLPNSPIAQSAAALSQQVASFGSLPPLYGLQDTLGRMNANLGSVAGNTRTQTVAGGNLYGIAANAYGDASGWTGIAKANGLSDPLVSGLQTLHIPPALDTAGGLLGL